MEDYEDGFEKVAVRFRERCIVRGVGIAFVLHVDKDNKAIAVLDEMEHMAVEGYTPPISANKSFVFNGILAGFRCKRLIRLKLLPDTRQERSYGRSWSAGELIGSGPDSPC